MANIHAINAQGTEYGLEAVNGITQGQVDAIATIGDVAGLETTEKATLVGAVNEVNEKVPNETVVYENPNPSSSQSVQIINVSGLANAKALKITFGKHLGAFGALEERVFPLLPNGSNDFHLSQTLGNASAGVIRTFTRTLSINSARSTIIISDGAVFTYDTNTGTGTMEASSSEAKVIKITALF